MKRHRRSRRERGVVLLLVLWVFLTLGVLALDFSQYMRDDAMATVNLAEETRGYYVALAGLNRALYHATKQRLENPGGDIAPLGIDEEGADVDGDGQPDDNPFPLDGTWHDGEFDGAKFEVRLIGEDGRLPLNFELTPDNIAVFTEILRTVVTNLVRGGNETEGVDRGEDESIRSVVDSVIDWRDCDSDALPNGAEDDYYLGQRRAHQAKNGYFDSVDELLQVRGVTPELFFGNGERPGLRDVFSIYPKGQEIYINAGQIPPEVIKALFPSQAADAEALIEERAGGQLGADDEEGDGGEDGTGDSQGLMVWLQQNLDTIVPGLGAKVRVVVPEVVRVEARGDISQPRNQAAVAAVVQLADSLEGPNILAWLDRSPARHDRKPDLEPVQDGPGA